jgi:hypothetical protein
VQTLIFRVLLLSVLILVGSLVSQVASEREEESVDKAEGRTLFMVGKDSRETLRLSK